MNPRALTAALVFAAVGVLAAPASAAEANAALLASLADCNKQARPLLERLVKIDSGTGDAEGLRAVGDVYAGELRALGATVDFRPPTPPSVGDNVVATLTGSGKGRILLIAHMDTVFARGEAARRPPRWEGDHLVGPGAGDDKSGGVTAICALRALKAIGFTDFARIDLLLNASEETGSLGSRDLIRKMARQSDLVINLERGVPTDKVQVARKGSAVLTFEVTGRAAHSGLEPEKGRNAALEAARIALALGALGDPAKQTTVVVDILSSGDKINVVPDRAALKADVRAFDRAEFDRIEAAAAALAAKPAIDGVTIKSSLQRNFPPWPRSAATDRLLAQANQLYAEIGRTLTPIEVGSSADVNYAAETGTPALDAFGMEGDGAHSINDYADFATLVPRAYLLSRLLMETGSSPPCVEPHRRRAADLPCLGTDQREPRVSAHQHWQGPRLLLSAPDVIGSGGERRVLGSRYPRSPGSSSSVPPSARRETLLFSSQTHWSARFSIRGPEATRSYR